VNGIQEVKIKKEKNIKENIIDTIQNITMFKKIVQSKMLHILDSRIFNAMH